MRNAARRRTRTSAPLRTFKPPHVYRYTDMQGTVEAALRAGPSDDRVVADTAAEVDAADALRTPQRALGAQRLEGGEAGAGVGAGVGDADTGIDAVAGADAGRGVDGAGEGDKLVHIQIGVQHFDLLKLIGEGAFGKVLLVRNRIDKKVYAMKVISKKLLKKKNNALYMKSERDILTKVEHPFIVSLYFAFQVRIKFKTHLDTLCLCIKNL